VIKAVIFDFFGVLARRGAGSFRKTLFPEDEAKNKQVVAVQNKLGLGQIGYDEFIDKLAKIGDVDRATVLNYTEDYKANSQLLSYISRQLKPKYKIGIISNAGADWVERILGNDTKLFDDIVLSYKVSTIKPDAEIYQISAGNLGVEADQCIFIDDVKTYCQGAEAVGMKSIWYQDFEQMKSELQAILSTSPDN